MSLPTTIPRADADAPMLSHHDLDGAFLYASSAATQVLGREASALPGVTLRSLVDPDDIEALEHAFAGAVTTREARVVRCRVSEPDGGQRLLELCLHGIRHPESDQVREVHCTARDVTTAAASAAEQERTIEQAREASQRLARVVASVPGAVWEIWAEPGTMVFRTSYISEHVETMTGYTPEEWLTVPNLWLEMTHPDDRESARASNWAILERGHGVARMRWICRDGRIIWVESHMRVTYDAAGEVLGMCGVTMDITATKAEEDMNVQLREEVIQAQARLVAELSTPLIPIGQGVVVMPIIGALDRARAQRAIDTLLHGVGSAGARVAILDITGVSAVDAEVAHALLRAAGGVQLLGAQILLTGIRPEVAQTLVALGADLRGVTTLSTLQAGIEFAARQRA